MPQTKTIRIFLGSSITELHHERLHLADYLMSSVRPIFKLEGFEVDVYKCEDDHSGNTGTLPQDEIDELLRNCDVSVFMFKEKAGKDTVHEFDIARELQKRKRHEIYVYCFDVPEAEKKAELVDFQNRLIEERFYWKTCKDITHLESQFVLGLLKYKRQLLGMPVADIEQESITEKDGDARFRKFKRNEQKQTQLQEEQSRLREEIHQDIDDLLQQTKTVMENEDETIAERIFKVIELYKKADRWAEATAYDKEKYSHLLFDYAQFLYKYGLYRDAESIYLRQIPLAEELYGAEHENTATSYNNIGAVYDDQGDYGKALEYYQKVSEIFEKVLGTEHSDTAGSYNNIGGVFYQMKEYPKALEYLGKAFEIFRTKLGDEHPNTKTTQEWIDLTEAAMEENNETK